MAIGIAQSFKHSFRHTLAGSEDPGRGDHSDLVSQFIETQRRGRSRGTATEDKYIDGLNTHYSEYIKLATRGGAMHGEARSMSSEDRSID